ncbi:pupal cuticle protein Edg-91-like [Saccostrea echinata]|uniref:pupal cuticle protein Edg-91-like n=1 Tax=Saccostrea echinata TaxID=191078 RepID=UPI002A825988|nr:pupal cuticle protein Edg-91-like [Saccostrea echinata]
MLKALVLSLSIALAIAGYDKKVHTPWTLGYGSGPYRNLLGSYYQVGYNQGYGYPGRNLLGGYGYYPGLFGGYGNNYYPGNNYYGYSPYNNFNSFYGYSNGYYPGGVNFPGYYPGQNLPNVLYPGNTLTTYPSVKRVY